MAEGACFLPWGVMAWDLLFRCWGCVTGDMVGMQFEVLLSLPEITACRNRKQRMGYLSCPVGCRLLPDVWAVAWAGAGPSRLCPYHATVGGESSHGIAKAAHSSERQPGHLLSPKHWERARLTCKSLHGDAVLSPSLDTFLICLHLVL